MYDVVDRIKHDASEKSNQIGYSNDKYFLHTNCCDQF